MLIGTDFLVAVGAVTPIEVGLVDARTHRTLFTDSLL